MYFHLKKNIGDEDTKRTSKRISRNKTATGLATNEKRPFDKHQSLKHKMKKKKIKQHEPIP